MDSELVLKIFGEDRRKATGAYREYMEEKKVLQREDVYVTIDQRIVGNERFVEEVKAKTGRFVVLGRKKHQYSLPVIAEAVEEMCAISLEQIRGKGRGEE